jgi:hypothetical protein
MQSFFFFTQVFLEAKRVKSIPVLTILKYLTLTHACSLNDELITVWITGPAEATGTG